MVDHIITRKILEIGQGVRPCEATLSQKVEIFDLRAAFPPACADWGEISHSQADAGARRSCQVWLESVQWVAPAEQKKLIFWPLSKFNTGSLPLRGILPVISLADSVTVTKSYLADAVDPALLSKQLGKQFVTYDVWLVLTPDSERDKKHHIFAPTAGARCTIFPKLCMVIELVVPIKKVPSIFRSNL